MNYPTLGLEAINALNLLAHRKGARYWAEAIKGSVCCHLCDETIWTATATNEVEGGSRIVAEHGINHLKEHNLLPFV